MEEADKGNLPRAELPAVPKEQKGKGVSIGGKLNPTKGVKLETGGDRQASKLKEVWNKAIGAKSKFKTFVKNL